MDWMSKDCTRVYAIHRRHVLFRFKTNRFWILPVCQSPSKIWPIQRNAKILDLERDVYPSPALTIRNSRGVQKNDGLSK